MEKTLEEERIIHNFTEEDNIEIVIEMPSVNYERDKNCIMDISNIMNNELLLQLNK